MECSPACPIHEWDGDESHDDHDGPDADGGVLRLLLDDARLQEEVCRVVEDRYHARQLLKEEIRNFIGLFRNVF